MSVRQLLRRAAGLEVGLRVRRLGSPRIQRGGKTVALDRSARGAAHSSGEGLATLGAGVAASLDELGDALAALAAEIGVTL